MGNLKDNIKEAFSKGYKVTKGGKVIGLRGKELSSKVVNRGGYNYFSLRINGEREIVLTHRLQAYQKYREKIFEKGIVVRHKNGNSLDNSWDNILIGTESQNRLDIPKEERIRIASNPKHLHKEIIEDRNKGMTYKELMEKYNISSKGTISYIINKSYIRNVL